MPLSNKQKDLLKAFYVSHFSEDFFLYIINSNEKKIKIINYLLSTNNLNVSHCKGFLPEVEYNVLAKKIEYLTSLSIDAIADDNFLRDGNGTSVTKDEIIHEFCLCFEEELANLMPNDDTATTLYDDAVLPQITTKVIQTEDNELSHKDVIQGKTLSQEQRIEQAILYAEKELRNRYNQDLEIYGDKTKEVMDLYQRLQEKSTGIPEEKNRYHRYNDCPRLSDKIFPTYNMNRIDNNYDHIFVAEGPKDLEAFKRLLHNTLDNSYLNPSKSINYLALGNARENYASKYYEYCDSYIGENTSNLLKKSQEINERKVNYFKYTNWKDHNACEINTNDLKTLFEILDNKNEYTVIHCSAGLGRSGTVMLSYLLAKYHGNHLDETDPEELGKIVANLLGEIRMRRPGMVQSREQLNMALQMAIKFVEIFELRLENKQTVKCYAAGDVASTSDASTYSEQITQMASSFYYPAYSVKEACYELLKYYRQFTTSQNVSRLEAMIQAFEKNIPSAKDRQIIARLNEILFQWHNEQPTIFSCSSQISEPFLALTEGLQLLEKEVLPMFLPELIEMIAGQQIDVEQNFEEYIDLVAKKLSVDYNVVTYMQFFLQDSMEQKNDLIACASRRMGANNIFLIDRSILAIQFATKFLQINEHHCFTSFKDIPKWLEKDSLIDETRPLLCIDWHTLQEELTSDSSNSIESVLLKLGNRGWSIAILDQSKSSTFTDYNFGNNGKHIPYNCDEKKSLPCVPSFFDIRYIVVNKAEMLLEKIKILSKALIKALEHDEEKAIKCINSLIKFENGLDMIDAPSDLTESQQGLLDLLSAALQTYRYFEGKENLSFFAVCVLVESFELKPIVEKNPADNTIILQGDEVNLKEILNLHCVHAYIKIANTQHEKLETYIQYHGFKVPIDIHRLIYKLICRSKFNSISKPHREITNYLKQIIDPEIDRLKQESSIDYKTAIDHLTLDNRNLLLMMHQCLLNYDPKHYDKTYEQMQDFSKIYSSLSQAHHEGKSFTEALSSVKFEPAEGLFESSYTGIRQRLCNCNDYQLYEMFSNYQSIVVFEYNRCMFPDWEKNAENLRTRNLMILLSKELDSNLNLKEIPEPIVFRLIKRF